MGTQIVALQHTEFEIIYFQKGLSVGIHTVGLWKGGGAVYLHKVQDMGEVKKRTVVRH